MLICIFMFFFTHTGRYHNGMSRLFMKPDIMDMDALLYGEMKDASWYANKDDFRCCTPLRSVL
jgi:hypothetical protein